MKIINKSLIERFDRSIVGGTWQQLGWFFIFVAAILILFIAVAFTFDLSIYGLSSAEGKIQGIIYHFLDPGGQIAESEQSVWVQIFTLVISISGIIFFGGMLITTIINTVERRVNKIEQGLIVYKSLRSHYIIIGYGEMTINVITEIYEKCIKEITGSADTKKGLPRIVILTNQSVDKVRADIHSQVIPDIENQIIIYAGDIESEEHLEKLNIKYAKEIYVLGERNEYGRDTKNIASINTIANLRGDIGGDTPLIVNVQFDRIPSYSIAQKIDIPKKYISPKGSDKPCIFFRPFNFHENWSRLLWSYYSNPEDEYSPLDFEEMEGDKHVHLIIVGLNRMGRALLLEAIRLCHYKNFNPVTGENRTKITVVDMDMDKKLPFFKSQYPYINSQIKDIDIEFIDTRVESESVVSLIDAAAKDLTKLLTIAICIKDPDLSMATGLNLPQSVYYQSEFIDIYKKNVTNNRMRPRVLIRQELHKGLGEILNSDNLKYKNVKIFGMLNKGISYELLDDRMPMYVNQNYNTLICGRDKESTKVYMDIKASYEKGDNSGYDEWLKLQEHYRWTNRYQIDMYGYFLREFKYNNIVDIEDIDLKLTGKLLESLGMVEHNRWVAEKTLSGWRQKCDSLGETRVEEFQIHTDIIPFSELDEAGKRKDYSPIKNVLILHKVFNGVEAV